MNIYRLQWTDENQERDGDDWVQEFYCWKKDLDKRIRELRASHDEDDELTWMIEMALLDKPITRDRMAAFLNNWFGSN